MIYSHPSLTELLPQVETVSADYKTVYAFSELMLKHNNPGVVGIRRLSSGQWAGTLITEKGKSK